MDDLDEGEVGGAGMMPVRLFPQEPLSRFMHPVVHRKGIFLGSL